MKRRSILKAFAALPFIGVASSPLTLTPDATCGEKIVGNANVAINPEVDDFIYITGDEGTDGSLRYAFTEDGVCSEERVLGVWSRCGLRI